MLGLIVVQTGRQLSVNATLITLYIHFKEEGGGITSGNNVLEFCTSILMTVKLFFDTLLI